MERGAADYVGGKVHTVGQVDLVDEVDFLGALGNEKAHPFGKLRVLVCELAVEEDDSTEGPRVILENSCNCGGARVLGEVSIAQDERGERQMWRQRVARAAVRAASVTGRREMMTPRRSSWRVLMRSSPR